MKKKFEKLSKAEKRVAVAKDVLMRIDTKNIKPVSGWFCAITKSAKGSIKEKLNDTECSACAKGSLFLSFIGFENEFTFKQLNFTKRVNMDSQRLPTKYKYVSNQQELDSPAMERLTELFTKKQLSLIESAFEGDDFDWNVELPYGAREKCVDFRYEYSDDTERLIAICKNIIKNKGTFKI